MDGMTQDRLLRLLGLGVRGRGAVVGVERVREAALKGTLVLAVVAPDASRHSQEKVRPLLRARGVPVIEGPGTEALGHAVGREATAVVGVLDPNLANGIQRMLGPSSTGGGADGAPGAARSGG
jgi:ribosomal protein L7Ae-like RNA K-turn-binding protein